MRNSDRACETLIVRYGLCEIAIGILPKRIQKDDPVCEYLIILAICCESINPGGIASSRMAALHRRHLCAGCGKQFRDDEKGIGNPSMKIEALFPAKHKTKRAKKTINFKQEDYAGGIQMWGSNAALLWTSEQNEEAGIHLRRGK